MLAKGVSSGQPGILAGLAGEPVLITDKQGACQQMPLKRFEVLIF
jgi:hypothetical protein